MHDGVDIDTFLQEILTEKKYKTSEWKTISGDQKASYRQ